MCFRKQKRREHFPVRFVKLIPKSDEDNTKKKAIDQWLVSVDTSHVRKASRQLFSLTFPNWTVKQTVYSHTPWNSEQHSVTRRGEALIHRREKGADRGEPASWVCANKGPSSQSCGFSSGHGWMWAMKKAEHKELMLLNCGVGEDSWECLGLQGDPTSPS